MRWCSRCVMPSTRPDLHLDDASVCDACRSADVKRALDWTARAATWRDLCGWAKGEAAKRHVPYDAVAGVSGGKDSTWIVQALLASGLKVLGVSFEPSAPTQPGVDNLQNLARFCDITQLRKHSEVYNKIRRIGLRDCGDPELPGHLGIFSTVVREACLRRIPLVAFGENPQAEYGGPAWSKAPKQLDRAWLQEFGGLLGLRVRDLVDAHGFDPRDLAPYAWPTDDELAAAPLHSAFLGDYFPWDTVKQATLVRDEMGFQWADAPPFGACWTFENLDDTDAVVFHDFLALCKFGYSRAQAQLSVEIRHRHRTRDEALAWLRKAALDRYPPANVEARFCTALGIPASEVRAICEKYRSPGIWRADATGPSERMTRLEAPPWEAPCR